MKVLCVAFLSIFILSCGGGLNSSKPNMDQMKNSDAHLIRTSFKSDPEWNQMMNVILTPDPQYGFLAYIYAIDDSSFDGLSQEEATEKLNEDNDFYFFFIADEITLQSPDYPVLCLELDDSTHLTGRSFRIKASELWMAQSNLSISNMDFEDFSEHVDSDGVYVAY